MRYWNFLRNHGARRNPRAASRLSALSHARLMAEPLEERTLLAAAPVADAGGPYTIFEGQGLTLDGSGSSDADEDPLTFSWDVNGDGTFGDAVGMSPSLSWGQLLALEIDNGPSTRNVKVRVDDGTGNVVESSAATLTINNTRPLVAVGGVGQLFRGEAGVFTFRARDASPADQAGQFIYRIDWDGNGTVDQTVPGPSVLILNHQYSGTGNFTMRVSATDRDGATSPVATKAIAVTEFVVRPSAVAPGKFDLAWGGTPGADGVTFYYQGQPGAAQLHVLVTMENGQVVNRNTPVNGVTGRIVAFGMDGNDTLNAQTVVPNRVEFYGGNGNDVLIGGVQADKLAGQAGDDILVGGTQAVDGNDTLAGGAGRDILLGMLGEDRLDGGEDDDLLVSEQVVFANLPQAMFAIQSEWVSARSYNDRVTNILGVGAGPRNNGNTFLTPTGASPTVIRDNAADQLFGGSQMDWFLLRIGEDFVGGKEAGEFTTTT